MCKSKNVYAPSSNALNGVSILSEWLVEDGDEVKFGDIIVRLEGGGFYCELSVIETGCIYLQKRVGDKVNLNDIIAVIK